MEINSLFIRNLRVIIAASICDGTIDDKELKNIQAYVDKESQNVGIVIKEAASDLIKSATSDPLHFTRQTLVDFGNTTFSMAERIYLINSAIEAVRADGLMLSDEIRFIKALTMKLGLSDAIVESLAGKWWIIDASNDIL